MIDVGGFAREMLWMVRVKGAQNKSQQTTTRGAAITNFPHGVVYLFVFTFALLSLVLPADCHTLHSGCISTAINDFQDETFDRRSSTALRNSIFITFPVTLTGNFSIPNSCSVNTLLIG